jgi:hypothetical protein
MPMRFTIDMASTIVIDNRRTRSAGKYITLPEIGVGACGKNRNPTLLQCLKQVVQSAMRPRY